MAAIVWVLAGLVAVAATALVYAWFEAGWLRTRVLDVPIPGLPEALDGLRVAHLSDFHLGAPLSRGRVATERAVRWVAGREPDLVCVTGDLVSHPRGESRLRRLLEQLGRPYTVLGNHDVAITRDPFSRAAELEDLREAILLRDEAVTVDVRDVRAQVVGVDPQSYREHTADPARLADAEAAFRLLLCHFPGIGRRLEPGTFDVILVGHLHGGQITIPFPGRPLALAHPRAPEVAGLYDTPGGLMHVSRGTGTTFVPLRFCARPEVTELVLRRTPRIDT
jgi:predicted MPP superfamily phosphohydrolase